MQKCTVLSPLPLVSFFFYSSSGIYIRIISDILLFFFFFHNYAPYVWCFLDALYFLELNKSCLLFSSVDYGTSFRHWLWFM